MTKKQSDAQKSWWDNLTAKEKKNIAKRRGDASRAAHARREREKEDRAYAIYNSMTNKQLCDHIMEIAGRAGEVLKSRGAVLTYAWTAEALGTGPNSPYPARIPPQE